MNRLKRIFLLLLSINIPLLLTIGGLIGAEYKIDRQAIKI